MEEDFSEIQTKDLRRLTRRYHSSKDKISKPNYSKKKTGRTEVKYVNPSRFTLYEMEDL